MAQARLVVHADAVDQASIQPQLREKIIKTFRFLTHPRLVPCTSLLLLRCVIRSLLPQSENRLNIENPAKNQGVKVSFFFFLKLFYHVFLLEGCLSLPILINKTSTILSTVNLLGVSSTGENYFTACSRFSLVTRSFRLLIILQEKKGGRVACPQIPDC